MLTIPSRRVEAGCVLDVALRSANRPLILNRRRDGTEES